MSGPPRWFLCAVAAPAILFGACAARPDWAAHLGLDVWNLPELTRQVEQGRRGLTAVDGELGRADERAACRRQVAADVCEGRLGLPEAAARFRDLNAGAPAAWYQSLYYAGDSEDERCCRQVIGWVRVQLAQQSPEEAARRTAELEQELSAYLRRDAQGRPPR
jgi:hypothetical protein